jgi:methionyl-tRNA formyltransferase
VKILSPFHKVRLINDKNKIEDSDFVFLLGCIGIVPPNILNKSKLNLVIHESDLPRGRGWSPLSWQVIEGKNRIPITLFEAREALDSGPIFLKDYIELDGTELLFDIKMKQGLMTIELVCKFLERWPDLVPIEQTCNSTSYPKRSIEDDKINVHKTIAENFDHLRIVDNEKYPAWFEFRGKKYKIKIYPYD